MGLEEGIRKFVNPEIVYGFGALSLAGRYCQIYGARRVLIVSDEGVERSGWVSMLLSSLRDTGIENCLYNDVSPNPRDHQVMRGAEYYRENRCDAIIAIGGGSPMDCAKGIGIVVSNNRHILDFEGVDRIPLPMPPLICIPTTAGTSADVSQFAIINDTPRQVKIAIVSKSTVPDVALIDPETTTTMDPALTACTGMDALVHAVEAYVSNTSSPLTDLHALEAVRLISINLLTAIAEPDNMAARNGMMLASLEAGLAFSNASLGAVHAMAHSLGGLHDLPHGECNALLLEHVIDFNFSFAEERYRRIAVMMGFRSDSLSSDEARQQLIEGIRTLRINAGIVSTLRQRGVTAQMIPTLAQNAMLDACMVTNPRRPRLQDIEAIYEQAL